MEINIKRLEKNLFELGKIGRNEKGGIDRALGSQSDRDARKWLAEYWKNHLNTAVRIDAIANMWVKREGEENLPPIVFGSHHDAVANGGMYDGALGVLAATEIMETLFENNIKTRHPFEIVSFTGEEPNPFNVSTLGSKVLSGRLKKDDLIKLKSNVNGMSLKECIEKIGGYIEKSDEILINKNDIRAFIELHIEQGRRLYDRGLAAAAVSCITGIYRENITIEGEANHAGTTEMQVRHDALLAASEFNLEFEKIVKDYNSSQVVGTIGYIEIKPNGAGIIPGRAELLLEIRTVDPEIKNNIVKKLDSVVSDIETERGVVFTRKLNLDQTEMYMDRQVTEAVKRGVEKWANEPVELVSMAGHDAANMQRVTKSSMIFVQSIEGKSHCPQENTDISKIEKAVNAMLESVLILDKELN